MDSSLACALSMIPHLQTETRSGKAHPQNQFLWGQARFTFLTSRVLRVEWSPTGTFEDRPTLSVCNRWSVPVPVQREDKDGQLVLQTKHLTLAFRDDGERFHDGNLSIQVKQAEVGTWRPGLSNPGNLRGTVRTLDNDSGGDFVVYEKDEKGSWNPTGEVLDNRPGEGFLSRDGWALVDDSAGIPLETDAEAGGHWVRPRQADSIDWYFFGHGRDYVGALYEIGLFFGHQPLPPRYTLGYWYSRYWAYTDTAILQLVDEFERRDLPLDVFVVDMDWHQLGWTGYTWESAYFPDPALFLQRLKERGLQITLNLHPAGAVGPHEASYPEFCEALGLDSAKQHKVPFDCTDPAFMSAYFRHLLHPHEDLGVDFWWLDWQQGERSALEGLDPLPWLNQLHWEDREQRHPRQRPLSFSRYGGPGAGRYPVGFSGDTKISWKSLAYQPWFTATASNVLYGYWSHDIGGHSGPVASELYLRWLQFGVYSPILRTHSNKDPAADRRVWNFEEAHTVHMEEALRLRYELVPYIYNANREACETGVSLIRPLYYGWPEVAAAYEAEQQYMFGNDLLVSPVISPAAEKTGLATKRTWLPEGSWWDTAWGHLVPGDRWIEHHYTLGETPVFARAGALLPRLADARRLNPGSYPELRFRCLPGGCGSCLLYEDDGISQGYLDGEAAWIRVEQADNGPLARMIVLHPAEGDFQSFLAERPVWVEFPAAGPGAQATLNGEPIPPENIRHDPEAMTLSVGLGSLNLRREHRVKIEFRSSLQALIPPSWPGLLNRLRDLRDVLIAISDHDVIHPDERLGISLAQTPRRIELHPERFEEEMIGLREGMARLPKVLEEYMERMRRAPKRFSTRLRKLQAVAAALAIWEEETETNFDEDGD